MSREYFKSLGKLYECPNPSHEFVIGRLVGSWRWAKESWCDINDRGYLVTTFIGITTTETPNGLKLITITLWKLCILLGIKLDREN